MSYDPNAVKLWVAELRGDRFVQGRDELYPSTDMFGNSCVNARCCLGVLDELAMEHGVTRVRCMGAGTLSTEVMEWAGLATDDEAFKRGCDTSSLGDENDSRGMTFTEIADIIESRPEGMFIK